MKMKTTIVVSGITFAVFFAEALIHYNYGILETKNLPFSWNTFFQDFTVPKGKSLAKMGAIVGVASIITSELISYVEEKF